MRPTNTGTVGVYFRTLQQVAEGSLSLYMYTQPLELLRITTARIKRRAISSKVRLSSTSKVLPSISSLNTSPTSPSTTSTLTVPASGKLFSSGSITPEPLPPYGDARTTWTMSLNFSLSDTITGLKIWSSSRTTHLSVIDSSQLDRIS